MKSVVERNKEQEYFHSFKRVPSQESLVGQKIEPPPESDNTHLLNVLTIWFWPFSIGRHSSIQRLLDQ